MRFFNTPILCHAFENGSLKQTARAESQAGEGGCNEEGRISCDHRPFSNLDEGADMMSVLGEKRRGKEKHGPVVRLFFTQR